MDKHIYEGMWSFDGSCAPPENGVSRHLYGTFTLGCFQWVKKSSGKGLKRGKVQHRVKGKTSDPKPAYEAAREYCAKKNSQGA
ncbi:hypothetical protein QWJ46_00815 [Rhizobium sp. CBN3]|uniref:hypothetical protein n=1 Tax=Rhizobium sp. CBN3 TaxID=3058045 RepID=UPI0026737CC6|nr:hypothetical protein [Rhizobium sp. CBN3]MDO3431216.1 hypothetical protein [Rhizobium sp. CBN3]